MHRAYRHDVRDADPENCRDDHVRGQRRDGTSKCHQSARDEDTDAGNDAANGSALPSSPDLTPQTLPPSPYTRPIRVLVELLGAVVDRRQARDALRQAPQAVDQIDEVDNCH